jgi:hypothetical protein
MIINVIIIISILEIETWNPHKSVHIQIFDFWFHFLVKFYQSKNRLAGGSSFLKRFPPVLSHLQPQWTSTQTATFSKASSLPN